MFALGLHLGPKKPQDGSKMAQDGPKMAQDGPKMAPRWPQIAPRWPSKSLKTLWKINIFALGLHFGPKQPQDGPRWSQDGPTWPQDGPKMSPRGGQEGLKRGPKRLQIGLPRLSNIEAQKGKDQAKVSPKRDSPTQTQTRIFGDLGAQK